MVEFIDEFWRCKFEEYTSVVALFRHVRSPFVAVFALFLFCRIVSVRERETNKQTNKQTKTTTEANLLLLDEVDDAADQADGDEHATAHDERPLPALELVLRLAAVERLEVARAGAGRRRRIARARRRRRAVVRATVRVPVRRAHPITHAQHDTARVGTHQTDTPPTSFDLTITNHSLPAMPLQTASASCNRANGDY